LTILCTESSTAQINLVDMVLILMGFNESGWFELSYECSFPKSSKYQDKSIDSTGEESTSLTVV